MQVPGSESMIKSQKNNADCNIAFDFGVGDREDGKTVLMVQMIERHLMIILVGLGRGEADFKRYFRGRINMIWCLAGMWRKELESQ